MKLNPNTTICFWGHTSGPAAFLSNFYDLDIPIQSHGREFSTSEHVYMWKKAIFFEDYPTAHLIEQAATPREAKALGRQVENFDVEAWDRYAASAMTYALLQKFSQDPVLGERLQMTGNCFLIEASPYDAIWGVGLSADDDNIYDTSKWKGHNLLGYCLMDVRKFLKDKTYV